MSDKDELDLEIEDTPEDAFDDTGFDDLEEGQGGEDTAAAPGGKSSGKLLLLAVLSVVVVGGGLAAAALLMGGSSGEEAPAQTAATSPAPQETSMTVSAELPTDSLPPQPGLPGPDMAGLLPDMLGGGDPAPMPGVGTVEDDMPWGVGAADNTAAADEADPWGINAAPAAPGTAGTGDSQIVDPFSFGIAPAEDSAPATVSTPADPFAVLPDTATTSVTAPVTTETAPPADPAPATAEMQQQVDTLTQQLTAAQTALEASQAALEKTREELAQVRGELAGKTEELRKAQAAAAQKTAAPATPPAQARTQPRAQPRPAAAPRPRVWVLRSAKPGVAWVSEQGSNEMRTVSVGDTLAGIGRVTSITTDAQGRWIVNGTQGKINQ